MIKVTNNTRFFKFFQPKLFYINTDIDKDDPVRLLSAILEEMDFSNLLQVFPNKPKVHPVNMFAVIIYAYSRRIYSTRDIEYLCKDSQRAQYLLNSSISCKIFSSSLSLYFKVDFFQTKLYLLA